MPSSHSKPGAGAQVNWTHALSQGLVHRTLFNGGNPVDIVAGRIGTPSGASVPTPNRADSGSMLFTNGIGANVSYLDYGVDPMTANLHMGPFTCIARAWYANTGGLGGGLARRNNGNVSQGWELGSNGTNFGLGIVCSSVDLVYVVADPPTGRWVWITVVHDGILSATSPGKGIYYDGVKQAATSTTTGVGTLASDGTQSLRVGEENFLIGSQLGTASWGTGLISDFALWKNRAFNADEVKDYVTHPYANLGYSTRRTMWFMSLVVVTPTLDTTPAISSWIVPSVTLVTSTVALDPTPAISTWVVPAASVVIQSTSLDPAPAISTWVVPTAGLALNVSSRVTRHAATVVRASVSSLRITRHAVTVIRSHTSISTTPPTPSDNPCDITEPIYWATIRPSGNNGAVYQGSPVTLRDPDSRYGGYKAPNVASISPIVRASSDFLTGSLPAQSVTVTWADHNRFVRNIFATVRGDWNNSELWVYLWDNLTRLANLVPRLLFYGRIKGDKPSANLTYTTPAYDVIGATYNVMGDEVLLPQHIFESTDFPGIPPASVGLGAPIIGGHVTNSDGNGAVELIDLGDFVCQDGVTRRCLGVAGHCCKSVTLYHNGSAIPDADFGSRAWVHGKSGWTSVVPNNTAFVEINHSWYTLAFVRGPYAAAYDADSSAVFIETVTSASSTTVITVGDGSHFRTDDVVSVRRAANSNQSEVKKVLSVAGNIITLVEGVGDIPVAGDTVRSAALTSNNQAPFVYADVDGMDTVGDSTGSLIDSLLLLDLQVLEQFGLHDYRRGLWAAVSSTFEFYPDATISPMLDRQSWTDADTVSRTYLSGGFKGAFVIGAQGKRRSLRAILADFSVSGNFHRSMRGNNQLFVKMLDVDRTRFYEDRAPITDRVNVLSSPRFEPTPQPDWLCNDLGYQFAANYRNDSRGDWDGHDSQGDAQSRIYNGVKTKRETYGMVRDANTANTVAARRLALMSQLPQIWAWSESLCGLNHSSLDGIAVVHYNGTGSGGFINHGLWILKQTVDTSGCTVTFEGLDVERLLTGTATPWLHTLTIDGGVGGGVFLTGTKVSINANAPPNGYFFSRWTGGTVDNSSAASTFIVMPAVDVHLVVDFEPLIGNAAVNISGTSSVVVVGSTSVAANAISSAGGSSYVAMLGPGAANAFVSGSSGVTIVGRAVKSAIAVASGSGAANAVTNTNPFAGILILLWDANPLSDGVVSYLVEWGTVSGTYTNSIDAGNVTAYALTGLVVGTTYYVAIKARNTSATPLSPDSSETSGVAEYTTPSGTRITDTSRAITDGTAVWSMGTGTAPNIIILRNGTQAQSGAVGSEILWYQGVIYVKGSDLNWYLWNGTSFSLFGSNDPNP